MEKDYINLQLLIEDLRRQIRKEQQEKAQLHIKIEKLEKQNIEYKKDFKSSLNNTR